MEAAVGSAFVQQLMMRQHSTLCAQTLAIMHNDAHCHSSDAFSTYALIRLENAFLMHRFLPYKGADFSFFMFTFECFSRGVLSSLTSYRV